MRLEQSVVFSGPIAEGFNPDEWFIGARSINEDVGEILKVVFDGVVQDDQEKVCRMDLRIERDQVLPDGFPEEQELARHRVVHLRGVPVWDYVHDCWVLGGAPVERAWIPELRAVLANYDGQNATVRLSVKVAIDLSTGFDDLLEFVETEAAAVFTPVREVKPIGRRKRMAAAAR